MNKFLNFSFTPYKSKRIGGIEYLYDETFSSLYPTPIISGKNRNTVRHSIGATKKLSQTPIYINPDLAGKAKELLEEELRSHLLAFQQQGYMGETEFLRKNKSEAN